MGRLTNRFNDILIGVINQPQIRMTGRKVDITSVINHLLIGLINQPQLRIEHEGDQMSDEITPTGKENKNVEVRVQGGSTGAVYGLGIIGAAIFYMSKGTTYQEKTIGFLKALVWPVFLVKGVLEIIEKE